MVWDEDCPIFFWGRQKNDGESNEDELRQTTKLMGRVASLH